MSMQLFESTLLCCHGSERMRTVFGSFHMVWTGTIWLSKRPVAWASAARLCERAANSSWVLRSTPYLAATFSEVTPVHREGGALRDPQRRADGTMMSVRKKTTLQPQTRKIVRLCYHASLAWKQDF